MTKVDNEGNLILTGKDRRHNEWCKSHSDDTPFNECKKASGCIMRNGTCVLNDENDLANSYISGGFGFGKVCIPTNAITDLLLLFIYPPIFVLLMERRKRNNDGTDINIKNVLVSFALTTMFYFPGLIHGLYYMAGKEYCSLEKTDEDTD